MNLQNHVWIAALAVVALVIALTLYLVLRVQRWWARRLGSANRRRGRKAEHQARKLLERQGYKVLDEQPRIAHRLLVNGAPASFDVNPDMLVRRDGTDYVVEVKNYNDSTGINNAAIRRQVIEYLRASGLPCLLIHMPEGRIDLIEECP